MAENYLTELKNSRLAPELVCIKLNIIYDFDGCKVSFRGLSLHEHQIVGLKHILQWHSEKHGGIIADEMGLGKTCQAVGAIVCLLNDNKAGRHMVICPLSVLQHWQNELFRFGLGKLRIVTYIGNADARKVIRKKLQTSKDWNVLVTTYEMVINDEQYFHWTWSSLFIDEAHRLKSSKSVLHQIVRKISMEFIVLMTGTPMQNNINELYSLLSLIDANRFSLLDEKQFVAKYQNTCDTAAELQHVLSKYLIRRTKQMLRTNIPDSSEVIIYHGITEIQKNIYRAILSKNYKYFENVDDKKTQYNGNRVSLLNVLMQLRKCVAHPYLFDGIESEPFKEGDHLFEVSGKFFLLDRLLTFLSAKGHRVLIFSQMTRVLDIAQDYLVYKGYNYRRLDGSVRAEERFAAVNRFQTNSDIFCFLLSTRAGGLGLNLTAGDTVIFLDSDFNPQNDIQAAARCHRIGQTKPVKIIRLVARYTVEDMIQCRAARKLRMTREILQNSYVGTELTYAEISDLIIKGLNQLSNEEIGSEELSTEEIEKLVGRTDENGHWVHGGEQIMSFKQPKHKDENDILKNMYIFEGHDYKQDVAVLQDILGESKAVELVGDTLFGQIERRKRRAISKEEMEQRVKKRKKTLERKKRLGEEEIERKKKEREARKAMKWLKN
uniref:Helicase n=1 Tax=Elaeophora elaphi TaxID=1147741 RepID=A0A0R3RLH1_9BILA